MNKTTPRIACLGWGSLIWNPGGLPIIEQWNDDGPMLPIEFARESSGQRITLAICPSVSRVRALWALLDAKHLQAAISALATRENISAKRMAADIGYVNLADSASHGACADDVAAWAARHTLDAVVWTNLPSGFRKLREAMPTGEQVLAHLGGLSGQARDDARQYVEKAPAQIDTEYRRLIAEKLGWSTPARQSQDTVNQAGTPTTISSATNQPS